MFPKKNFTAMTYPNYVKNMTYYRNIVSNGKTINYKIRIYNYILNRKKCDILTALEFDDLCLPRRTKQLAYIIMQHCLKTDE